MYFGVKVLKLSLETEPVSRGLSTLSVLLTDLIYFHVCYKTLRELFSKRPKVRLPAASCVSGSVLKVGALVTRCSPGDRVAGNCIFLFIGFSSDFYFMKQPLLVD